MDPFTQRMLERARLRREKLDSQLINTGQEISTHNRTPLREQNQTHLVKITTEEVSFNKPSHHDEPAPASKIAAVEERCHDDEESDEEPIATTDESEDEETKENVVEESEERVMVESGARAMRNDVRSQLRRLGELYSDSPSQLSSPIHRTEETFFSDSAAAQRPAKKTQASSRLAALANTINQWEDDLSHPTARREGAASTPPPGSGPVERTCSIVKVQRKATHSEKKPVDGGTSPTKQVVWDKKFLDNLGSPDKTSPTKGYVASPQGSPTKPLSQSRNVGGSPEKRWTPASSPVVAGPVVNLVSPDKRPGSSPAHNLSSARLYVRDGSPAANSVLRKTQMFEATSPTKRRDPTEMSLSERMALFERNKGEALVPKVPFSMSVPVKYLARSEGKTNVVANGTSAMGSTPVPKTSTPAPKTATPAPKTSTPTPKTALVANNEETPTSKVLAQRRLFERGGASVAHQTIAQNVQSERQKDMDMLLNRWNVHKNVVERDDEEANARTIHGSTNGVAVRPVHSEVSSTPPPPPPPMPGSTAVSPAKDPPPTTSSYRPSPTKQQHSNQPSPRKTASRPPSPQKTASRQPSPQKTASRQPSPVRQYPSLADVKKIKVSPPKPGKIYPCLSDIEAATETESEMPDEQDSGRYCSTEDEEGGGEEMDSSCADTSTSDTSFGRSILQAVSRHATPSANNPSLAVLEDMDHYLAEAMDDGDSTGSDESDGPTPPKKTRARSRSPQKNADKFRSPTSAPSHSFKYSRGESYSSPVHQPPLPTHVVEEGQQLPLLHTVSFYRRQQNMGPKKPSRLVTRQPEPESAASNTAERRHLATDADAVRDKVSSLLDDISKHQTIISQASQALNLCSSTVEFSGSAESVEGERLLLLATHRRQAALNEIQRLKVEGSLKALGQSGQHVDLTEKGSLTATDITLPLKKEYIRNIVNDENTHYFVCLLKSQDQVVPTPVLSATRENLKNGLSLVFGGPLKLVDLYNDFKVSLEVYTLQARKEMLPHEVKYHINKKDGKRMTPKKKNESLLLRTPVQSPAGPGAVRSPAFQLAGYVMFSLRELHRTHFTLNKVAYTSPLEGQVQLRLESQLSIDVTERGFLTMFEDVSGFGAWHRRWCVLKGATLSFWKYPDDEKRKVPMGCVDLSSCSTEVVGLVSRDICARPNTFLLETRRAPRPEDEDSLVLVRSKTHTTIRHLLSADTREERALWCSQVNKALTMLRAWSNKTQSE